jgi:hypothetical protein
MAVAMKCDRCGKFYTEEEFEDKPVLHVEEWHKSGDSRTPSGYGFWKNIDMCPSCVEALEHFMKCEPIDVVTVRVKVDKLGPAFECGAKYGYPKQ